MHKPSTRSIDQLLWQTFKGGHAHKVVQYSVSPDLGTDGIIRADAVVLWIKESPRQKCPELEPNETDFVKA